MPIRKDGNGVIQYTPLSNRFKTDETGVHPTDSFQICDDTNQLKQVNFDLATMADNSKVKLKFQNPTPDSEITITFPSTDTTLGSGGGSSNSFATIQPDSGTSPTATSATDTLTLTSANGFLTIVGNATTDTITYTVTGLEPALGNPSTNGYVLSSTTGGTRSWVAQSGGSPGGSNTQVQFNSSGSFGGDAGFTWNNTSKFLDMPTTYGSGEPTIRMRDSTASWLSGNSALDLTHGDGAGLASIVAYNGAGIRIQAQNASATTNFGQMVINSSATTVSSAGASREVLVVKHAASATGNYISVQGSSSTNPAFIVKPASSSDASARVGIQSTTAGLGTFVPLYPLEMAVELGVDANSFVMRTTDGVFGNGTGGFQINPCASSGLGLFSFLNTAGATAEFKNADGSSFYSIWRADSNGLTLRSGNAARKPLVVKAEASHSTNLVEVQDSSANVLASFDASGDLSVPMLAASKSVTFAAISSKSANYTLTENDYTVICDTTSGSFTITLPAVSGITGRIYNIKKMAAANTLTIDGNASETIDGATTVDLFAQYSAITIQCTGSAWVII